MSSKLIEKIQKLGNIYYVGDDGFNLKIHYNSSYETAIFKKIEPEYPKFINSLVNTFEIIKLMTDIYCHEPNIYEMITKMVLGVKYIIPFTNDTFMHVMKNMMSDQAIAKYGNPKYWDVTQVTNYSTYMIGIYKNDCEYWNLHPSINKDELKFNGYYFGNSRYFECTNVYITMYLPAVWDYHYCKPYYKRYIQNISIGENPEIDEELKEKKKIINTDNKGKRKEYQRYIKRQNKMSYKNNKCKSNYR